MDPGHQGPGADTGGTEPLGPGSEEMKDKFASGTQGVYTGVPEYELTLNISMQLQAELKSRGYEVIMTREDNDTAVSNVERAQIAAENGAEILVRIHADGSEDNSANGAMTMIPSAENPYALLPQARFAKTPTQEQKRDAIDCRMETQQPACGHE